jgi:hypothetical protein
MVARAFLLAVSLYLAWVRLSHPNKETIMKTFNIKFLAGGLLVLTLGLGGCLTDDKGDEDSGPTISVSPDDEVVNAGSQASFSVVASGSGTLTYQWQKDGDDIPGATAAVYTFTAGSSDDGAEYKCKVTDDNGSTTSNGAFLRIRAQTKTVMLGAQNNATASSLDLDTWTAYTQAQGAANSSVIDIVFAYSTAQDSAALYSPIVAKNGVGGTAGFDFMQSWPSPNSTDIRVVSVADINNVITAADIKALYDQGSAGATPGRVFVRVGTTVVAKSNSNLHVLLLVTAVTQSASGTASITGKAKW